jgi:hypothetical protein
MEYSEIFQKILEYSHDSYYVMAGEGPPHESYCVMTGPPQPPTYNPLEPPLTYNP